MLDYLIATGSLVLIGVLALADSLPAWLLVAISAASSLTGPLSGTGLRSLFPIIVPEHLWERVNAVDSNAYVFSGLIGPPMAGAMVQLWGGPVTIIAIGFLFAAAALVLVGVRDPETQISTTGKLLVDAWQGLQYAWRNPTIRGIGLAMTAVNLSGGVLVIVLPIIILNRLHEGPAVVGLVWAAAGVCGIATAIVFGRRDSSGRERRWFTLSILGYAFSTAFFLFQPDLLWIIVAMAIGGLVNGPLDIAMFTLRQRRTDPAWMGRAFAISMSFNFAGFPIGSAIAGAFVEQSLELTVAFAVVACLAGAVAAWFLVPREASPIRAPSAPPEVVPSGGSAAGR